MMVDILCPLVGAASQCKINTNFARSSDLKNGTIKDRLICVKPTLFLGVPRVWEKFKDGLDKKIKSSSKIQQKIMRLLGLSCFLNVLSRFYVV
jgi:long-subunit acyl-CoA synthetase (AMP-forming)